MDQPHNQFLWKEFIFSDVKMTPMVDIWIYSGNVLKINLYSTGNIDVFKKDINYSFWGGRTNIPDMIDGLIFRFYHIKEYIWKENEQIYDIRNYLDKITFVPTEHISNFTFYQKEPINEEILSFVEYIINHNKGKIEEKNFESIHYILESQSENDSLVQVIYFNQFVTNLIIIFMFVFIVILNIKNKYK